ncbi:Transient receptor potential cation channel subfamily M member 3 [Holothuria leucospilota]|uniref:Transient receptor potential cation channel subfamily M member 3 n=1 Tax=Holothuria leucospilota TaxID=206669 RepID=A0A9Q1C130_HOLLE|nr:Transient receptor potential cation channel subfamily M member 3 [Holothuria leucospilota]
MSYYTVMKRVGVAAPGDRVKFAQPVSPVPGTGKPSFRRVASSATQILNRMLSETQNPSWIKSNMRMRECIRFTEAPPPKDATPDDPKCQCGKKKSYHEEKYQTNVQPKVKWKAETHTQVSPTNAYGEIEFVGSAGSGQGQQKLRKFVRVEYKTPPKKLLNLIQRQWNLGQPKLLISVTGGALDFTLNSRLKDVFRKGLIKAALSTGAWIITGGSNSGVMRYVGEAVRDYAIAAGGSAATNVVAIGIATWGVLDQQEALIHPEGRWPATYRMDNPKPKGPRLDPNHTHFILVDDGTTGKFGVEIKLRSKLEKEISEQKVTRDSDERLNVPSVCVVVEGGPNTVQTVYEAIKNGTPCLIIAGSGRAADILAYAFKKARSVTKKIRGKNGTIREETRIVISESALVNIAEMLDKVFKGQDLDLHLTRIKECIQYPNLINVYELDGQEGVINDIDSAILHALLKANKGNVIDQLQLALVWNRVDVAQREIFTDDNKWEKGDLDNSVRFAIEHNLPEFLDLFIENGVSMKDYLTDRELTVLYNKIKSSTLLYDLLFKQSKNSEGMATLYDVGKIIQALTMDTYQPLYLTDPSRFRKRLSSFGSTRSIENQEDELQQMFEQPDQSQPQFSPIRELFILSILLNRKEMARLLWERIDEAIPAALTASKMLKAMASKEDDLDQKENMVQHAEQYEELAIGVLNECYDQEEDRTLIMMIRELPNWGNTTCLTMAVQAQNRKFIAQSVVQNLLTQIWMGKISDENSYWKLWVCMFCPPAVNLTVWFREDERSRQERDPPQSSIVAVNESFEGNDYQTEGDQPVESLQMVAADNGGTSTKEVSYEIANGGQGEHYTDTADVDIRDSGRRLTWWQRIKLFYNAPIIKFRFNVLAYFAFLFLFSYIILTDFEDKKVSWKEWLLIAWVATLYTEEFRQIAHGESNSWRHRILHWISDYWNMVDVATLLLFGVGLGLRFSRVPIGTARIILALDLLIFYVRLLQSFSVSRNLGPKLIMIARMMVDLLFFVCILAVFLIGYGVASYAIMFPNQSDAQKIFTGIFYQAYFQMYGELFLEEIQVEGCTDDPTLNDANGLECPEYSWMGILLLCGYMMLSNVLLLNLLIAMFSYTFSNVQDNTDELWKFQRYEVINEFFGRPPVPPPFIIISHCFFFFRFVLKKCCRCCPIRWSSGKLKQHLSPGEVKQFVIWEAINADNFITKQSQKSQENMEERVKVTSDRVQTIMAMMDKLLGEAEHGGRGHGHGKPVDERLTRIEDQLDRTNKAIDWIIASMSENKLSVKEGPPQLQPIKPREEIEDAVGDDSEEDHDVPSTIEELGIAIHVKSRTSPYPGTAMRRFHVSDNNVPWSVSFPEYEPVNYTHKSVLAMPHWADQDLLSISKKERPVLLFNQEDPVCQYNRVSHMGTYIVQDGLPLNPKGRTGMIGRGMLGRFGPNHAADPIVTRWKRNQDGEIITEDDKPVLEFIAIQRRDNQQWAIPGGMVEPGHQVSQTLLREFSEEALGELDKTEEEREALQKKVQELLKHGTQVYKGYVDDPRNTDNAWMETVAMNFHDDTGEVFAQLEDLLQAGDDAQGVRWQRVSSKIPLFASHTAMLSKVAEIHKAAF